MKTIKRIYLLVFCVMFFATTQISNAQVTIGSEVVPNVGALLDLKEDNTPIPGANSTKGFNLPRVTLESLTSLKPCYTGTDGTIISNHKGLQVYNINTTIGEGVYCWDGTQWVLNTLEIVKPSTIVAEILINRYADTPINTEGGWGDPVELGRFTVKKSGLYNINITPSFKPNPIKYPSPANPFSFSSNFYFIDYNNVVLLDVAYYGYASPTGIAVSGSLVAYLEADKEYTVKSYSGTAISVYNLLVNMIHLF